MERMRPNAKIRREYTALILVLFVLSLVLRVIISAIYYNTFDTFWYLDWARQLPEGFFNAYEHISSLDYPPLYLYFLYPVGLIYNLTAVADNSALLMILLKAFPVLFDSLVIVMIYLVTQRYDRNFAVLGSMLYAFNPATIYNCACWGQTDSMMIFMLLLTFRLIEREKYEWSGVMYALCCLLKFQCAFFAPVYILAIIVRRGGVKRTVSAVLCGILTGIIVFFPFVIYSGFSLPLRVFMGGFGKYPYATLNAANVYGGLNWQPDTMTKLFGIPLSTLSGVLTVLIVAAVCAIYIKYRSHCFWEAGFLLMNSLFILTTRMHERYQIPVLLFLLMAYMRRRNPGVLVSYILLSLTVFLNQALVLVRVADPSAAWTASYDTLLVILSCINLAISIFASVCCICDIRKEHDVDNGSCPEYYLHE